MASLGNVKSCREITRVIFEVNLGYTQKIIFLASALKRPLLIQTLQESGKAPFLDVVIAGLANLALPKVNIQRYAPV